MANLDSFIADGVTVNELIEGTGLTRPAIINRLRKLERAGVLELAQASSRGRPLIVVIPPRGDAATVEADVVRPRSAAETVGLLWLTAPLAQQRAIKAYLSASGAMFVADCVGDAAVFGLFDGTQQTLINTARVTAEQWPDAAIGVALVSS